jgi:hypothetical protein
VAGNRGVLAAQARATDHVNSWFARVTKMVDRKSFDLFMCSHHVSLDINSGFDGREKNSSFRLDFLDIFLHLTQTPLQLDEQNLLEGFLAHTHLRKPPLPQRNRRPSECIRHLGWMVYNACAFLKSFANAEIYTSIQSMSAARATVSVVYVSLYRFLLDKSGILCSYILRSMQLSFKYCKQRSWKDHIDDALRALTQYYRVVYALANMELSASPGVASLLSDLQSRATTLLRDGHIKRLILLIHAMRKDPKATVVSEMNRTEFRDLLKSYTSEVPEISPLSIALRVESGDNSVRPAPTEAFRDADPYHHYKPIKVRDLLKESDDILTGPQQQYIDYFVDNFDDLGHTRFPERHPIGTFAIASQEKSSSSSALNPSTSLDPSHASLRASQQDTDARSVTSESTVKNDFDVYFAEHLDNQPKAEPADHGWNHVPLGKGRKRRQRSNDSGSRGSSGDSHRKHFKHGSGRESPNYFGILTQEPAALR